MGDAAMHPKLPQFKDADDIVSFIIRFQRIASFLKLDPNSYPVRIGSLLGGKAYKIYAALSPEITDDYQSLKPALHSGFNKTTDSYRNNFKAARIGSGETYQQFVVQLGSLFDHWFDSRGITKSFEYLREVFIVDQLLSSVPVPLRMYIK